MQTTRPWFGRLAVTILGALLSTGSWACQGFSWDTGNGESDRGETYHGPRDRTAIGADVRCFDSFGQFKRAMEKEGKKQPGYQWHHIVPQHEDNKKLFGERNLHCTDNLVYLRRGDHEMINGLYSRKDEEDHTSLRERLKGKEFGIQYAAGCQILKEQNVEYTEPVCL